MYQDRVHWAGPSNSDQRGWWDGGVFGGDIRI
jgi:monoamine oxidase